MMLIKKNKGFTLIELVLVILLLGIIAGTLSYTLKETLGSYQLIKNRKNSITRARLAIERLKSDLLLIDSVSDIDTATANALQFDLSSESNILYSVVSLNLTRSGNVLANNVNSITFRYYNINGIPTTTISDIRRIQIVLTVNSENTNTFHIIKTSIYPRNLGNYENFRRTN